MTRTYSLSLLLFSATFLFMTAAVAAGCGGSSPQAREPRTVAPQSEAPEREASASTEDEQPPVGRLPRDVEPQKYTLALTLDPTKERFGGKAIIEVQMNKPRALIWMHGRDLTVSDISITPEGGESVAAEWEQVDDEGVAAVRLPQAVGPGKATIEVSYGAAFNRKLQGLYRVDEGGESYAFTQFEATSGRLAFPGFDEPSFKTPFDVTLIVREDHEAAANTPAVEEEALEGGLKRIRYATTKPMPTYLVAWAVGPLDVVEAEPIAPNDWRDRPVPLRGIAVKGKGERMKYALEHTAALLEAHEEYFDGEYPYAKLDIVAVPDFAAGAMENVGLVTFREAYLMIDEESSESMKRAYAGIMAHELAHMWFGNLVTMPWWDDIWLNEAFATWMAHKVVGGVFPDYRAELRLLDRVQGAMRHDSLASARQIRQPIESNHDIRNAFDSITYSKGAGVLAMFEQWMGEEQFRQALRAYMRKHAWGNATADDLLQALSEAAGRDVATPFRTFLLQPGLPFVEVEPRCEDGESATLSLKQARYLPVGSEGDRDEAWQLPFCARYGAEGEAKQACTLLTERKGTMELESDGCPAWIMPNAEGAGYFRFSLPAEHLDKLRDGGWDQLTAREKLAVADSVRAGFASAALGVESVYGGLETLARSDVRPVTEIPMDLAEFGAEHLVAEEHQDAVRKFGRELFQPTFRKLGWEPRRGRGDDGESKLHRAQVISFLALEMEDPQVRREAVRRARRFLGGRSGKIRESAVDANLVGTVLAVAMQEGDAELFDRMLERFTEAEDPVLRGRLLKALSYAAEPELAERARALALDERLRVNEIWQPLEVQASMPETREATWKWLADNWEPLTERISRGHAGYLPWLAAGFCSADKAQEVESFFETRVDELPGGPRNLAGALEAIRLCAARVEAHQQAANAFFD